jgi:hypothetical protein
MKSRRHELKQVTRRIRRDRRRLGRFVVFAEMLADLRPISLVDRAAPFEQAGSDQGTRANPISGSAGHNPDVRLLRISST